jgi:hypothetical protein
MSEEATVAEVAIPPSLHVLITREPFSDFFTITLDNGHSEELEVEDTRLWFKQRGADMDKMEKVLDHVWNFYRAEAVVDNPKEPSVAKLAYSPRL